MELLSLTKRKSRKSSSDSSSDSPDFMRRKEEKELEEEEINAENRVVVLTALSMAKDFASKAADEIVAKLSKLDAITLQIHFLQQSFDKTNVSALQIEVAVAQINGFKKLNKRDKYIKGQRGYLKQRRCRGTSKSKRSG